jgi:hypothetical protein
MVIPFAIQTVNPVLLFKFSGVDLFALIQTMSLFEIDGFPEVPTFTVQLPHCAKIIPWNGEIIKVKKIRNMPTDFKFMVYFNT